MRSKNDTEDLESVHPPNTDAVGVACAGFRAAVGRHFGQRATARASGIRSTADPRRRISMDARLLGVERRRPRLLLGSRHLGRSSAAGLLMDAWLLGRRRRAIFLARRLLGTACRLLWWCELRSRLWRQWL